MYKELLESIISLGIITADDVNRLTAIELMLLIIERHNGLLEKLQSYIVANDKRVSDIELSYQDTVDYIEKASKEEVLAIFNQWVKDGTFATLIEETALTDIDSRLDELERKDYEGFFIQLKEVNDAIDHTTLTVDDYYSMYDSLMIDTRFRSRTLGKDQSGTYDIKLYVYEPTFYKSTLMVNCSIHGWEHYGAYIMYRVFKILLNDQSLPKQLEDLRNTRIICIPVSNPWGLMADNHTGYNATRRGNSNGVDLNRNFGYRWDENTGNFGLGKGEAAFSEVETQLIKEVMESYNITHFWDIHSFNKTKSETRDYLFYGTPAEKYNTEQMIKWLKQVYTGIKVEHTVSQNDSSANNYANCVRKIPSMNTELIFDISKGVNQQARKWTEFVLNYLMLACVSFERTNAGTSNGCKLTQREASYQTQALTGEWAKVPSMGFTYSINTDGIMMVDGWISVEVTGAADASAIITISPYIEQDGLFTIKTSGSRSKPYIKVGNGVHLIPINVRQFVRKGYGDAVFNLEIILEGTGTATIKRKDAYYTFIPTDHTYVFMGQHNKVVSWRLDN